MGIVVFLVGFFIVVPGAIYYYLPQRKTYENKKKLFLLTAWSIHSILVVPWFLLAIYSGTLNFSFTTAINDTYATKGLYEALVYGYFYFIFYISIFIGPLVLIERKIGKKLSKFSYGVTVIWFWSTVYIIRQFIINLQAISRELFPSQVDSQSQMFTIGYLVLVGFTVYYGDNFLSFVRANWPSKAKD